MASPNPDTGAILARDAFRRRRGGRRDARRESRALDDLIGRINRNPGSALQALTETVVALTGAGSAGVSILQGDRFVWPAIAGHWAKYVGGGMPVDASPCGVVIERSEAMLFTDPQRLFPNASGEPMIHELLLIPMVGGGRPFGTLWALSHDEYRFNNEDGRILERLGLLAAALARAGQPAPGDAEEGDERIQPALKIIKLIVRRLAERAADGAAREVAAELGSRIGAYADVILAYGPDGPADLWLLLAENLRSMGEREGGRIKFVGPAVSLSTATAAPISLAIHELLDNAFRHGALKADDGRVLVEWGVFKREGSAWLSFRWSENRPTSVLEAATSEGFGFDFLLHMLPRLVGGSTWLSARPPGLLFELEMPL
ncbi:two-component sensor histidine kinase [Sphingomonas zeicaulis]|uniref:GAF domain-containing protein n=1 Tax=Sphingomonas zeicaulis TaxID=1632740 RepID=UPI003D239A8B